VPRSDRVAGDTAARPAARSRRDGTRSAWGRTIALVLVMLSALASLHVLLEGLAWIGPAALVAILVLVAAALVRALTPSRTASVLVGALALLVGLTLTSAADTALLGLVPTPGTAARAAELVEAGRISIVEQGVPAEPVPGIVFLITLSTGVLTLVADVLASVLRAPAAVAAPPLVLMSVPVVVEPGSADLLFFVLAAIGYLAVLASGRPSSARSGAGLVGGAAIVATLVVPPLLPDTGRADVPSTLAATAIGVNPLIDLGADLRRPNPTEALRYTTDAQRGLYLKLTTLEDFTGDRWEPRDVARGGDGTLADLPAPVGLAETTPRDPVRSEVRVSAISGRWLPVPYPAVTVDGVDGDWAWDADALTVRSSGTGGIGGQEYVVESLDPRPSQDQLRAAPQPALAADTLAAALVLPDDVPAVIGDTAREVTAGAGTAFDQAVQLQSYLRGPDFRYSEETPVDEGFDGTGLEAIARFLEVRSGYCVHFASTMAVMARELGIPSRVSVGFTPGERDEQGDGPAASREYSVSTSDLHAWPELYFEGAGWVRFEPTPGRGELPDFPAVTAGDAATGAEPTLPAEQPEATPSAAPVRPDDAPQQQGGAAAADDDGAPLEVLGVGALVVAVLAAPAVWRSVRRIRRRRLIRSGSRGAATAAWAEVLDTARDHGFAVPEAASPRSTALRIPVGGADAALARLRTAVEREAYARETGARDTGAVDPADVDAVLRGVRESVDGDRRAVALLLPRSLLPAAAPAPS